MHTTLSSSVMQPQCKLKSIYIIMSQTVGATVSSALQTSVNPGIL
jgi:hypothetical protein